LFAILLAVVLALSEADTLPGVAHATVPVEVLLAPVEGLFGPAANEPLETESVVVTLFDAPSVWPAAVAVTDVVVVPVGLPGTAAIGSDTVVLAPAANVTAVRLVATAKSVLFALVTNRLKVVLVQLMLSLLVILTV